MDRSPRETRRSYPRERNTTFWTGPNRNVNGDNWRREPNEYVPSVSAAAAAAAANTAVAATTATSVPVAAPGAQQQQQQQQQQPPPPNSGRGSVNVWEGGRGSSRGRAERTMNTREDRNSGGGGGTGGTGGTGGSEYRQSYREYGGGSGRYGGGNPGIRESNSGRGGGGRGRSGRINREGNIIASGGGGGGGNGTDSNGYNRSQSRPNQYNGPNSSRYNNRGNYIDAYGNYYGQPVYNRFNAAEVLKLFSKRWQDVCSNLNDDRIPDSQKPQVYKSEGTKSVWGQSKLCLQASIQDFLSELKTAIDRDGKENTTKTGDE